MLATSLVLGLLTVSSSRILDDQYRQWETTRRNITSLVVEFEFEYRNELLRKQDKASGSFRFLRTDDGEQFASLRIDNVKPSHIFEGLMIGRTIYDLRTHQKHAIRFDPHDGDPIRFLADHAFPFAALLDRKRTEDRFRLAIDRRDEWYSYLRFTTKDRTLKGIFEPQPCDGVVALMGTETPEIPKFMPRTIAYGNRDEQRIYHIRKWGINPKAAPTRSEFQKPEDRKGWTVSSGWLDLPSLPIDPKVNETLWKYE